MAIIGGSHMDYNVSDVGRAVQFYAHVLGLGMEHQDDAWAALDAGGVTLGLHGNGEGPFQDRH